MESINLHIQAAPKSPNKMNTKEEKMNTKKNPLWHLIVKPLKTKDKEKNLKATHEKKHFIYREMRGRISLTFLSKTMAVRRRWNDIFKVLKEKPLRIIYPRIYLENYLFRGSHSPLLEGFPWGVNFPVLSGGMCVMGEHPAAGVGIRTGQGRGVS